MNGYRNTPLSPAQKLVVDRMTSAPTREEIFRVLAELGPETSSAEIAGRLSARAGAEMLAAVRGMHAPDVKGLLGGPVATARGFGGGF